MKPTISNPFKDISSGARDVAAPGAQRFPDSVRGSDQPRFRARAKKSTTAALVPMQADMRETDFGWSLELSPMTAGDALDALLTSSASEAGWSLSASKLTFLVGMEQSAWRDGETETPLSEIARRLAIKAIRTIDATQLVMDELSLRELVCLCQPTRLLIVAVEGEIESSDARAMSSAIDASRSPLLAELRAVAALEVLGDRSIVLHCRNKNTALNVIAENFRHFLAAVTSRPASRFQAPQAWQIERLMGCSGAMTVRPIETQVFSTSIDVGINTSAKERFSRPADRALIYDLPSGTWHDEA